MSARIGSAWKKFRGFSSVSVGKQDLSLKQQAKIYQCCVRPFLLRELTVALRMMRSCVGVALYDEDDVWGETGL